MSKNGIRMETFITFELCILLKKCEMYEFKESREIMIAVVINTRIRCDKENDKAIWILLTGEML